MTRSPYEQRSSDPSASGSTTHSTRPSRRPVRTVLSLALAPALALGTVALTAPTAHAAVPQATATLPQGRTLPSTAVAFGSTIVWDTQRSSDTGSTWNSDASLSQRLRWDFAGGGNMARVVSGTTTDTAVVYTPSTNAVQNFTIPTGYVSLNATYVAYANSVAPLSTGTQTAISTPANGSLTTTPTVLDQQLSTGNALVWFGTTVGGTTPNAVAVATTPTATPTAWQSIPQYEDGTLSDTDLQYVTLSSTSMRLCKRSFSSFTTPNCFTVVSGNYSSGYTASVRSLGTLSLVHLLNDAGTVDQAYVVNGTTANPVQLPTGSIVRDAFRGGSPYLIVQDANTVPSVVTVDANGVLTPSFAIPATVTAAPQLLAVAPDRVVGADSRDGSTILPVWSRPVSAGGFGSETSVPSRAIALTASAGRTAVMGPSGVVSMYDRGALQQTFTDHAVAMNLTGPYLTESLLDPSTFAQSTRISLADGTGSSIVSGWPVDVFGSQYVTAWVDSLSTGQMHVVVRDLTGKAATVTYDLPAGTAACYAGNVWGSRISVICSGNSTVYDYTSAATIGSTSGVAEAMGDGYALVHTTTDDVVWNLANGTTTSLGCSNVQPVTTDGVGHIACSSATNLVWQDYSSLSTSAPRLLGIIATPTVAFGQPGSTWSLAMDATKALGSGYVSIKNSANTEVKQIPTSAAPDGSVRVTWDGLNGTTGKPVPAGTYTYTLVASATDGTGAIRAITGSGPAVGTVTITGASTLGMAAGGFSPLAPSRLLDTRITGPALGAGATRSLTVTGVGGVPTTGVSAVVLNVTVTNTTSGGYLTVSPTGTTRPVVSNLNWSAGATVPNAVTVKVGTNGQIDLYQPGPGTADVIVDVAGYYLAGNVTTPGGFTSLAPSRILDTRIGYGGPALKIGSGENRQLQVTNAGGVPTSNVSAVVLNVTVTDTNAVGYLTVYPADASRPLASNLNWNAGATVANLVTVKLSASGAVNIYQSGPGSANVIADVAGYFLGGSNPSQPGMFVSVPPARVLDTRTSTGPLAGLSALNLPILNKGGVAQSTVSAVVVNATVTDTHTAGYLTVYPGASSLPTASNLNWSGANATTANLVTAQVGSDGSLNIYNGSPGSVSVIVDTAGYYCSY